MKAESPHIAKQLMEAFMFVRRIGFQGASGILGRKPSEIAVLYCLSKAEANGESGLKVSELSKRLNVTSPTVTQLVKSLEGAGLVERKMDHTDRRVVHIHLKEAGREVIQQSLKYRLSLFHGLVEHLGEEESARLADSMKKAAIYLKEQRESILPDTFRGGSHER